MTTKRDFDSAANSWDEEPRRVKLAVEIAAAIKTRINLSSRWDALDFGCGTGLVTLELAPLLRSMTGVDSSCGMLDKLAEKISSSGIRNVQTQLRDLAAGKMPAGIFHLITSAMTLHHIKNPVKLLSSLTSHIHPGGWIALADLAAEDGSFHDDPTGIFHHGFSQQDLVTLLESSGYSHILVAQVATIIKGDRTYPVLLAVAQA